MAPLKISCSCLDTATKQPYARSLLINISASCLSVERQGQNYTLQINKERPLVSAWAHFWYHLTWIVKAGVNERLCKLY